MSRAGYAVRVDGVWSPRAGYVKADPREYPADPRLIAGWVVVRGYEFDNFATYVDPADAVAALVMVEEYSSRYADLRASVERVDPDEVALRLKGEDMPVRDFPAEVP